MLGAWGFQVTVALKAHSHHSMDESPVARMGNPSPGSHRRLRAQPEHPLRQDPRIHLTIWGQQGDKAGPCTQVHGLRTSPPPGEQSPGSCTLTLEAESLSQGPSQPIAMNLFWFLGCSVESSDVNWKKKKSGGIKIMCQSEIRDFSAMAFITDHVNSLIDQWFPGKKAFLNQALAHGSISL